MFATIICYSYKYVMTIRDFNLNKNMGHLSPQCYSTVKAGISEIGIVVNQALLFLQLCHNWLIWLK